MIVDAGNMGFFMMGGVVVAALLIYRIVDFMLNKYGNGNGNGSRRPAQLSEEEKERKRKLSAAVDKILAVDLEALERQSAAMFDLHNVKDREGVPIWYVRSSLEEAIKRLVTSIDSLVHEVRDHMSRTSDYVRGTETRRFSMEDVRQEPKK